jgi:hypothetical protein
VTQKPATPIAIRGNMALRLTYWGVFESNYPRNRMFIDELGRLDDVSVRVCHVPLFEKDIDKSRSYFSLGNLVRKGLRPCTGLSQTKQMVL